MKKLLVLAAIAVFAAALVGCNPPAEGDTTTGGTTASGGDTPQTPSDDTKTDNGAQPSTSDPAPQQPTAGDDGHGHAPGEGH